MPQSKPKVVICRTCLRDNPGQESFADFERTMRIGMKNWYRFISLYYRLNVMFTYFLSDKKYRLDILQLLQGDVYHEEPEVLTVMERMVAEVENNKHHPWHRVLGELTCREFKPAFKTAAEA